LDFIIHTFVCLLILSLILAAPLIIAQFFQDMIGSTLSDLSFIVAILAHIGLIVYFYLSKKYSLFALPLSHIISSVPLYFIVWFTFTYAPTKWDTPWQPTVIVISMFYLFPIALITFIISLVIKLNR